MLAGARWAFLVAALLLVPRSAAEAQSRATGAVVVTVLDERGDPFSGAWVRLFAKPDTFRSMLADEAGVARFDDVPSGVYGVRAEENGTRWIAESDVRVEDGISTVVVSVDSVARANHFDSPWDILRETPGVLAARSNDSLTGYEARGLEPRVVTRMAGRRRPLDRSDLADVHVATLIEQLDHSSAYVRRDAAVALSEQTGFRQVLLHAPDCRGFDGPSPCEHWLKAAWERWWSVNRERHTNGSPSVQSGVGLELRWTRYGLVGMLINHSSVTQTLYSVDGVAYRLHDRRTRTPSLALRPATSVVPRFELVDGGSAAIGPAGARLRGTWRLRELPAGESLRFWVFLDLPDFGRRGLTHDQIVLEYAQPRCRSGQWCGDLLSNAVKVPVAAPAVGKR